MKEEKILFELNIKNSIVSFILGLAIVTGVVFGKLTEKKHCYYDDQEVNCEQWDSKDEIARHETVFNYSNAFIASISTVGIFLLSFGMVQFIKDNKKSRNPENMEI
jgi:hypothetical protein